MVRKIWYMVKWLIASVYKFAQGLQSIECLQVILVVFIPKNISNMDCYAFICDSWAFCSAIRPQPFLRHCDPKLMPSNIHKENTAFHFCCNHSRRRPNRPIWIAVIDPTSSADDSGNVVDVSSVAKLDTWWRQTGNARTHLHAARYNTTWEVVVDNHRISHDTVVRLQSVQRVVKPRVRRCLKLTGEARRQ